MLSDRFHDELLERYSSTLRRLLTDVLSHYKKYIDDGGSALRPEAASAVAIDALLGPLSTADQTLLTLAVAEVSKHPSILKLGIPHLRAALNTNLADLVRPLRLEHENIRTAIRSMLAESTVRVVTLKEAGQLINQRLARPISNAKTLANTALAQVGRQASMEVFKELSSKGVQVGLGYSGPSGGPIRPFCSRMVGKVFTREQVSRMKNSSGTSCLMHQGGYNCRHSWSVVPLATASSFGFSVGTEDDVVWSRDEFG